MSKKKALIIGISGQDGCYLSKFLLEKGYEVHGASRDSERTSYQHLEHYKLKNLITFHSVELNDFRSIYQCLVKTIPDEIYNLSGQSSVGLSFDRPVETFNSISIANMNLLEAIRILNHPIKLYNASSSECFGNIDTVADENTPFRPRSPYATAKAAAFWHLANYREAYNLFACSGILFNHESVLRHDRFVTKKIITTALRIKNGSKEKLSLGRVDIVRDWGYAPEYIEAMWLMLQQNKPDDYVVATGVSYALKDFVRLTFEQLGLDCDQHTTFNPGLERPTDILFSCGNPTKAANILGWKAKTKMPELIQQLLKDQSQLGQI